MSTTSPTPVHSSQSDMATENALSAAVRDGLDRAADLHLFDKSTGTWTARSWADVIGVSETVAARLQSRQTTETPGPVAIIGEPSFDMIATVLATWMAGRASTILPGPNRFASLDSWGARTKGQLGVLGITEVFSQGTAMKALAAQADADSPSIRLTDLGTVSELPLAPATFVPTLCSPDAPAVYQGTAGSTGVPKSVQLTADAVLHNVRSVLGRHDYRHGSDVLCSWLPLYHDMGLMMLLSGMIGGAPTWIAPTSAFAKSPFDWPEWLTRSKATVTAAPNFAYALLGRYARLAKGADLGNLRVAINGGEPIDVEATQQFSAELAKHGFDPKAVSCSYGLAEATCGLTMPSSTGLMVDEIPATTSAPARKVALLGPALDGVQLRIEPTEHTTDFDGSREVGEVEFRSTAQMIGYFGDRPVVPGEWIRTGDLGYLVGDQLVVCGRSKELITIAGRNIFPQEIERAAAGVPGVRPGGVAAVTGSGGGARGGQLVIVAEFIGDDATAARAAISELVAADCGITPGTVDFVEAGTLPKTTSGKLRRVEIAAGYR